MYHPMTGKKTKLKIHWQPDGAWQLTHAQCGVRTPFGVLTAANINAITCLKCMDIATRPEKGIKDAMPHSCDASDW